MKSAAMDGRPFDLRDHGRSQKHFKVRPWMAAHLIFAIRDDRQNYLSRTLLLDTYQVPSRKSHSGEVTP